MKKKKGRKRIGQPISITLTPEQRAWVDSQIKKWETRTMVIREIIQEAMSFENTECFRLVSQQLGSKEKARSWFVIPNPLLGDVTPIQMINLGRTHKLLQFIKGCIEESTKPETI